MRSNHLRDVSDGPGVECAGGQVCPTNCRSESKLWKMAGGGHCARPCRPGPGTAAPLSIVPPGNQKHTRRSRLREHRAPKDGPDEMAGMDPAHGLRGGSHTLADSRTGGISSFV